MSAAATHLFRAVRVVGAALGALVVFVIALVAGVLLHLDLPAARRFVSHEITAVLDPMFMGKIQIEGLGKLGTTGVEGVRGRVLGPDGDVAVAFQGARGRISLVSVVKSALAAKGELEITLEGVVIDYIELNLTSANGELPNIARAFDPKNPTPASAPGRGLRLSIPGARVRHAWVHGQLEGAPPLDADIDALTASMLIVPPTVKIDVPHLAFTARGLPMNANPVGEVEAHVLVPAPSGRPVQLDALFAGAVAGIPATARASTDLVHIEALVDVAHVSAEKVRALIADAPMYEEVSLRVEALGDLPKLDLRSHITVGDGVVDASGDLTLADETRLIAKIEASAIDVRAFSPTLPRSSLGATTDVVLVAKADGAANAEFRTEVHQGSIAGNAVPSASIHGVLLNSSAGVIVRGKAAIAEPGARTEVAFDLHPVAGSEVVDLEVHASVPRLDAVPRVGPLVAGSATLAAKGTVRLADRSVDGAAHADLEGLARGSQRVAHAALDVRARGPLDALILDTTLAAEGLEVGKLRYSRASVTAHGSLSAQQVDAAVSRGAVTLSLHADAVRLINGGVTVDGAVIDGIGESVRASFAMTPGKIAVTADSMGVDLKPVAYLAGIEDKLRGGRVMFDVDLTLGNGGATGHVVADMAHGSFSAVNEGVVHVEAAVAGRRGSASVHGEMGAVGHVDLMTSELEIGGTGALTADSWKKAWGRVEVDAKVDLAALCAILPDASIPVGEARGTVELKASTTRESSTDMIPELTIALKTSGLDVSGRPPEQSEFEDTGAPGSAAPPWHSVGVDVQLDATIGADGALEASTRVVDRLGAIVALDAKADTLPYAKLFDTNRALLETLEGVPFRAKVVVPSRKIQKLPAIVDLRAARGEIEATIDFAGTLLQPNVDVSASAQNLKSTDAPLSGAINAQLLAHYDGHDGGVVIKAGTKRTDDLLDGTAHIKAEIKDLFALGEGDEVPWEASLRARLNKFPLNNVAFLSDREIRGRVSGALALDGIHKDARATAQLMVENLQIGNAKYAGARLSAAVSDKSLLASFRVDQEDGFVEGRATVGTKWGSALAPSLDGTQRLEASLLSKNFRAAGILPFVGGALSELDGRIDADARASIEPNDPRPHLQGSVTLSNGLFQLASMGAEFHDTTAKVVLLPDGTLSLEDVVAYGITGKVIASGSAHLNGVSFVDAKAHVQIPKGQSIPLDVNGTQMGELYGDFNLSANASADQKTWNIDVQVPSLHPDLPTTSKNVAQDLGVAEHAHFGTYRGEKRVFFPLLIDGASTDVQTVPSNTTIKIAVHLGDDIEIRRGTTLKIALDGNPSIEIRDQAIVSGQIRLKSGILDVQGKRFEIEKGTVSFVGTDASNPLIVVTAGWTAPDGTRVYADFVGPLKTGKVTLRSEPSRSKNEIVALILFGTVDGSSSTPYASSTAGPDNATRAGSAAGSFASEGLSRGIDELTGLEITAKVDTTDSASPRPEVELQIARDISLQISYVLAPTPGTNLDTTFATIDWRFFGHWSLATTFGDKGSSIADVVWQYRY